MSDKITDTLKNVTKDFLSEENLKEIETAFHAAVNEKVELNVKKALIEQDEDYANKLQKLVEAIDNDHTSKLTSVVNALDTNHAEKLKAVVEKHSSELNKNAEGFKTNLVEKISKYLELYLDEKVPTASINEAVRNKRAYNMLCNLREALAVDMALANESIKDAVVDGKKRLDEAAKQLEASSAKVEELTTELNKVKAELTLEKKLSKLDEGTKTHLAKMFEGKPATYIAENFDYALGLYEKAEKSEEVSLKEEAIKESVSTKVDRPVVSESVEATVADPAFNAYLGELKKY